MRTLSIDPQMAVLHLRKWATQARDSRRHDAQAVLARLPRKWQTARAAALCERTDPAFLEAIGSWSWETHPNVVLLGRTGVGKSTAAALLFRRLLSLGVSNGERDWERAQSMRWFRTAQLAEAQRGHPLGRGEAPDLLTAKSGSLLFLDDVGWEKNSNIVESILSARYEDELPTVLTSGLNRDQLTTRYGDAVARRMAKVGVVAPTVALQFSVPQISSAPNLDKRSP